MKKLFTIFTLLVYFVVNTGFVISVHYCMDEVNGVEIGHSNLERCNSCGMFIEDKDGCCKVVKMHVDQTLAKIASPSFHLPLVELSHSDYLLAPLTVNTLIIESIDSGPPLGRQDTYLQNCVFRI